MFNNYSNWSDQWLFQNDGLSENEHQLSVAGKIKKHFNTGPKPSNNTPGVSVMTVSPHWNQTQLLFSCLKLRINIKDQTPCVMDRQKSWNTISLQILWNDILHFETVKIDCEYYLWWFECFYNVIWTLFIELHWFFFA